MGNACCKCTSKDDDDDNYDRSHIISSDNNQYDTQPIPRGRNGSSGGREFYMNFNNGPYNTNDVIPYGSFSCGNKTPEQAALDRIYHKLALNLIDVAPGETMIIQPAEICERQKAYQSRLSKLEGQLLSLSLTKTGDVQTFGNPSDHAQFSKLVSSRLTKSPSSQPHEVIGESGANSNGLGLGLGNNIINRQKLYHIPDRRRVEYGAIYQDEEELIREYSLRSMKAVRSIAPTISEPVITQFNL